MPCYTRGVNPPLPRKKPRKKPVKNQQQPEGDEAAGPALHIHSVEAGPEQDDERWTWCYVEPATGIELFSNETYATREGATEYARRAYPDVPFADEEEE